jgi:hypothetical protein
VAATVVTFPCFSRSSAVCSDRCISDVRSEKIIKMKVVEFMRQSPSCVKRCKRVIKVCELNEKSSDDVRCDVKCCDYWKRSTGGRGV